MGKRWGNTDFRQLKDLHKRLERLSKVELDAFCMQAAKDLSGRLLSKAKKRTLPGVVPEYATEEAKATYWSGYTGGNLRDSWTILPIEKSGDSYVVTLINNNRYASYVEYGHRQRPGRYVPQLGLQLKDSWVEGRFMLTISTQELEQQAPAILERKLYKFLKECLDAE